MTFIAGLLVGVAVGYLAGYNLGKRPQYTIGKLQSLFDKVRGR